MKNVSYDYVVRRKGFRSTFIELNPVLHFFDSYYTHPRIIKALLEKGIRVVGTARPKRSWPATEFSVRDNAIFNDLFYCSDDFGNLGVQCVPKRKHIKNYS